VEKVAEQGAIRGDRFDREQTAWSIRSIALLEFDPMQRQGSEPCELGRLDLESKAFDRQLIDQSLIEPSRTQDRRDRAE
jgi:hypothetical protein